ncbi:MAG: PIG-L family deacetylase, partial [Myxococcaceae bacterium]
LTSRTDEKTVTFKITPPKGAVERARLKIRIDNAETFRARRVRYDHVPPLTVRESAEVALVPLTLTSKGRRIGYIPGAGDRVAESLVAVGYEVSVIPEERIVIESLNRFDAIVVGVRAFNANERLAVHREPLLRYVEQGGRLIVQYNTNSRVGPLKVPFGPYPLEIGRDRVTDETAAMNALAPDDALLLKPNHLTAADYEGWVQERGLYFASTWDPKYRAVLSLNDPGEAPLQGALLVAKHGKGVFVYTGLSFFRQLPAGVPGAYRLFANLLAL